MALDKSLKSEIIDKFKVHENDTGSAVVQIAILTSDIKRLTEHLQKNKKDFSSRVGLIKMIERRRKFLKYIKSKNVDTYSQIISQLGLRK